MIYIWFGQWTHVQLKGVVVYLLLIQITKQIETKILFKNIIYLS